MNLKKKHKRVGLVYLCKILKSIIEMIEADYFVNVQIKIILVRNGEYLNLHQSLSK